MDKINKHTRAGQNLRSTGSPSIITGRGRQLKNGATELVETGYVELTKEKQNKQRLQHIMVAKRVGTNSTISVFFCILPLIYHTMLIYLEIWIQSIAIGVRFVLPNVLSSKSNIFPGGGGYHFHLRGDLLKRPLKG